MSAPEPTPTMAGYSVDWDGLQWVATSECGRYTLRGKDQAALERARTDLCRDLLAELRNVLDDVFAPGRSLGGW